MAAFEEKGRENCMAEGSPEDGQQPKGSVELDVSEGLMENPRGGRTGSDVERDSEWTTPPPPSLVRGEGVGRCQRGN